MKYWIGSIALIVMLFVVTACGGPKAATSAPVPTPSAAVMQELMDNAKMMGHFKPVRENIKDLQQVMVIPKKDPRNIYGVSDEVHYYSASTGKTFILCKKHDALNAILDGNTATMPQEQLNAALKPWKDNAPKIMEMMMGDI